MKNLMCAKKLIYGAFLLCFTLANAQTGTVNYKNEALLPKFILDKKKKDPEKYKHYKEFGELLVEKESRIAYTLKFNKVLSEFKADHLTSMQKKDKNLIKIRNNKHKFYYCRTTQKRGVKLGKYFVNYDLPNWEITKKTKLVQGYVCKKATAHLTFYDGHEAFQHKVVAWFAPEFPYPYGPEGYGGLPGLILELIEPLNNFVVTGMTIPNHSVDISWPNTEKNISHQLVVEKAKKRYENR